MRSFCESVISGSVTMATIISGTRILAAAGELAGKGKDDAAGCGGG